jgi:glycosyltransferase involved in cell wall biosynthesis
VQVTLFGQAGEDGLPPGVLATDVLHLHWLELWGRPKHRSLSSLTRWGPAGRSVRRWVEPALNSSVLYTRRRRRFLDRFLPGLVRYQAAGGGVVYTVHNLSQHEDEASNVELAGLGQLLGLADAVHVHSRAMAEELQARFGGLPQPVIIPHGNYVGAYANDVQRPDARRQLEVAGDSFVFLFLGLIRPYKGLEELLPAFASLADPRVRLLVAGRSRPRHYARDLARMAAADARIHWHPHFVPDNQVQLWMNAADVVVLPYRRVTTSGAALLALSFGKPVVAPALPAFAELMGGNEALGLLYDPNDPDDLVRALEQARSIDWQARQGQILPWVRQLDWADIGRRFVALYEEVKGAERKNKPQ